MTCFFVGVNYLAVPSNTTASLMFISKDMVVHDGEDHNALRIWRVFLGGGVVKCVK